MVLKLPWKKETRLRSGQRSKQGDDSRAVVVITPRSAIRIAANSEVVIEMVDEEASPKQVMIDLKDGSLGALLKPNSEGALDFKVRTPSGVAAARGDFLFRRCRRRQGLRTGERGPR